MVSATSQKATWDEISTLGYFYYQELLTRPELKLLSHAQNCEIPGHTMCYFEVAFMVMLSQFHGAKFLGIQHMSVKCSYYLLFLGIHVKGTQKYSVSQCKMEGQEEPLSDTDTTSSTDLELVTLDNL